MSVINPFEPEFEYEIWEYKLTTGQYRKLFATYDTYKLAQGVADEYNDAESLNARQEMRARTRDWLIFEVTRTRALT